MNIDSLQHPLKFQAERRLRTGKQIRSAVGTVLLCYVN